MLKLRPAMEDAAKVNVTFQTIKLIGMTASWALQISARQKIIRVGLTMPQSGSASLKAGRSQYTIALFVLGLDINQSKYEALPVSVLVLVISRHS